MLIAYPLANCPEPQTDIAEDLLMLESTEQSVR